MPKTKDTFARRLRSLREAAGLSIPALADLCGITRVHLWRLEQGRQQPSLDVARKVALALGRGLDCWDS